MRQSTIRQLVAAAMLLDDDAKAKLAKGKAVKVTVTKGAKLPVEFQPSFGPDGCTVTFRRKED